MFGARHTEVKGKSQPRAQRDPGVLQEQACDYQQGRNELKERIDRDIKSVIREKTQLK